MKDRIGIFIVVRNNEMLIASKILMLRKDLEELGLDNNLISVIDNGSEDRTTEVASQVKARVIRYSGYNSLENIMTNLKKRVRNEDAGLIVLIDGNSSIEAESVVEMIDSFLRTGKRSGMGYLTESREDGTEEINALIFRKDVFRRIPFKRTRIGKEEDLLSFGSSIGLKIDKKRIVRTDEVEKKQLFRIPLRSAWDLIRIYRRNYPLRFYGGLFWVFNLFALIPGVYLFGHWLENSIINYPSFMLMVLFSGIGLIFLSTGLILNAMNTLSEKIGGMI